MRKLTPTEIKETVEKIRKKYDEYAYKFFKASRHKNNFEQRYIDALKSGVDISNFLLAEIGAIEELVMREETKVLEKPTVRNKPPGGDTADHILEEFHRRIVKYPDRAFHPDAREEVRRLFGALHTLEQEYWPALFDLLRNTSFSLSTKTMISLETQLHSLGGDGRDGVAARLERYLAQLARFPRNYPLIEKEEKDYILESAFFLHEIYDLLGTAKKKHEPVFTDEEKQKLDDILDYIHNVITDFRLKELKRK